MYLRGILLNYFIQKKSAAAAHEILVETYGVHGLSKTICRDWFRCIKNNDFDMKDKECTVELKKFENKELEEFLYEESCQAQAELAGSFGVDF